MFERLYRQRLEADLARWQANGVIAPAVGDNIRGALPPLRAGVNIAAVVGIVGGLLIAAAFLAFVAANWLEIARPTRLGILLAGIAASYGVGAWFAGTHRPALADLGVTVGTIIYGAAIALVGQMYHIAGDFAGGMLLWASGALAAAVLTGSRGALATSLAVGMIWSGTRALDVGYVPHLPFTGFWLIAAALALVWNSRVANHLVALAALAWWITTDIGRDHAAGSELPIATAAGATMMLGAGLALATTRWNAARDFGLTLATYGAFALALAAVVTTIVLSDPDLTSGRVPHWAIVCGAIGVVLAYVAAGISRRTGPVLAAVAGTLVLVVASGLVRHAAGAEPWFGYALELIAMLCLVVSGMLDADRPRVVAGWLGLAAVIIAITWGVRGSLLRRSIFLAIAGAAAVACAVLLGRLRLTDAKQ